MKALVIVDIQNDFLPGGTLAVKNGDEIVPVVNELQQSGYFDLIIATQDWHPRDHGSFASNHPGKEPFEMIKLSGLDQVLWPDHCIQETKGAEFSEHLKTNQIEAIFRKGMDKNIDSYSGFFDNVKLKDTGLGAYLKGRAIDEVFVAGLAGDFCVYYTAMDAIDSGLSTKLIEDATRPIDADKFEEAKINLIKKGGRLVGTRTILRK